MEISFMRISEIDEASELVLRAYDTFVLPDMSGTQSRATIENLVSESSLGDMIRNQQVVLMARESGTAAGVIVFRENHRHLLLLFVAGAFHGRGIARKLWETGKQLCLERRPEKEPFTVNSSPFALGAYERFGFVTTGPELTSEKDGIVYTPMKLTLPEELPAE